MQRISSAIALTVLLLAPGLAAQQVTGRVVDQRTGQPMAAVQVFIPGSGVGALTQQNGRYLLLNVPVGAHELTAQRIGYKAVTQQVTVAAGQTVQLDFTLAEEALGLDEIVVTGTPGGTQRRAIGNSVLTVEAAAVTQAGTVTSMQDLLVGRSPGVQFNRNSGNIGTGSSVQVRGIGSFTLKSNPLVYVDGVRVDNSSEAGIKFDSQREVNVLNDFNPADIASIEIIKGPAAATLYGTEASAGVIQIITKRGQEGAAQFEASVRQGVNYLRDPAGRLGPKWSCTDKFNPPCSEQTTLFPYNGYVEANRLVAEGAFPWPQDQIYQHGQLQEYNIDIRGGTQAIRYFVSANYGNNVGIVYYNWDKAFRMRANVGAVLSPEVSFDLSTGFVDGETRFMQPATGEGGEWHDMAWGSGYCAPRISGKECPFMGFQERFPSDVAQVDARRAYDRFTGSATLNLTPARWLSSRVALGLDKGWDKNSRFYPLDTEPPVVYIQTAQGQIELEKPTTQNVSVDASATASRKVGPLGTKTSAGAQYYVKQFEMFSNIGQGFPSPLSKTINQTPPANALLDYSYIENKSIGVYVQEELGFGDRLFITGAVRFDDNSAFGGEFDLEKYPKLSGTWVVSDESFWKVGLVNSLRLRGAWGKAGRQPDAFASTFQYNIKPGPGGNAILDPSAPGNPKVGPETSSELELGFDVALLQDRVSGQFSWFHKTNTNALLGIPLPTSRGFPGSTQRNVGRIDDWGWEATLNNRVYESPDLSFSLDLTAEHVDNEIKELGDFPGSNSIRIGWPYPNYGERRLQVDAYYDPKGTATDVWGRKITALCDAGVRLGPTAQYGYVQGGESVPCAGLTTNYILMGRAFFSYKFAASPTLSLYNNAVTIHLLLDGAYGKTNMNVVRSANQYNNSYLARCECDPGFSAEKLLGGGNDKWYDASFWKLREVSLMYTLPSAVTGRFGADRATIAIAAREVATLWVAQRYSSGGVMVPDPESDLSDPGNSNPRVQPPNSTISATLRVNF